MPFGSDPHPGRDLGIGHAYWLAPRTLADAIGAEREAERHAAQSGERAAAGELGSLSSVVVMAQPSLDACSIGGDDAVVGAAAANLAIHMRLRSARGSASDWLASSSAAFIIWPDWQ